MQIAGCSDNPRKVASAPAPQELAVSGRNRGQHEGADAHVQFILNFQHVDQAAAMILVVCVVINYSESVTAPERQLGNKMISSKTASLPMYHCKYIPKYNHMHNQ